MPGKPTGRCLSSASILTRRPGRTDELGPAGTESSCPTHGGLATTTTPSVTLFSTSFRTLERKGSTMWFASFALVLAAAPPEETPTTKEQLAEHVRAMVKESRAPAEKAL